MAFLKRAIRTYFSRGFYISGPQFFSIAIQLVTLPIVLRSLSQDAFGGYQFAFSVFTWATLFTVGNITLGASRGIATDKKGTFLYAFLYRLRIVVPLGLLLILASYFFDTSRGMFQQLIYLSGAYLALGFLPQVSFSEYFVASQQFRNYFSWQSALSIGTPILSAIAAAWTHDVRIYTLVQFGSITLISICGFAWVLMRNGVVASYRRGEIDRSVIRYGFSLAPAEIVSGTAGQATSFIIGPFFGFANLAIYSVASRIDSAVRNFLSSFYHVWYADFARKNFEELRRALHEKRFIISFAAVLFSAAVAVPGFIYIRYAIPGEYSFAAVIYAILVVGFPAVLLQAILHTFLTAHLRHRALVFANIIPSALRIILIIAGGYAYGVVGIAVAVSVSTWINYAFYYGSVFHREFLLRFLPKRFRKDAFAQAKDEQAADM